MAKLGKVAGGSMMEAVLLLDVSSFQKVRRHPGMGDVRVS